MCCFKQNFGYLVRIFVDRIKLMRVTAKVKKTYYWFYLAFSTLPELFQLDWVSERLPMRGICGYFFTGL